VIEQLEQALLRIARQPRRRLVRSEELIRVDKLRRVDGAVRRAVLQGKGRGRYVRIAGRAGVPHVREYIEARTPVESLDTPEHRVRPRPRGEAPVAGARVRQAAWKRVHRRGAGGDRVPHHELAPARAAG